MRVVVDTGKKQDLTAAGMASLNAKLRAKWPTLDGWSYSPLTGELELDFGDGAEMKTARQLAQACASEGIVKRVSSYGNEVVL
jgi:hypothetical protein